VHNNYATGWDDQGIVIRFPARACIFLFSKKEMYHNGSVAHADPYSKGKAAKGMKLTPHPLFYLVEEWAELYHCFPNASSRRAQGCFYLDVF